MTEILKIIAAAFGLFAAWYFKDFLTTIYQKYLEFKAANALDAAKKKAEADQKKFSDSIKGPRGPNV